MKKFFTLGIATALLMITVANMKAQDAQNPWHLIAFETEKEVAFYNTEVITGIEATEQNVTIVLENGKEFSHPTATTTFGFDPRREGTATANESFTTLQWNVYYTNGRLHFSEAVNSISVFTITGALVARFAGYYSEVLLNLPAGIYIVQADGKSAKLPVNNGFGSAVSRKEIVTKTAIDAQHAPIGLRSENSIKEYWNIIANSTTMSIKIADVEKFSFKLDTLVFTLKNGGTIELSNYQGVEFTIEPAEPTTETHWDLERTFAVGGGAYGFDNTLPYPMSHKVEFISVVSNTDVIIYDVSEEKETKYSRNEIPIGWLDIDNAQITFFCSKGSNSNEDVIYPAISYVSSQTPTPVIQFNAIDGQKVGFTLFMFFGQDYGFNGHTNEIPTTFTIDKDGNLVAAYVNADGISRQHIFKK